MDFVVSSIVEVSMNKIALWIVFLVDDWTAEWAIIVGQFLDKNKIRVFS